MSNRKREPLPRTVQVSKALSSTLRHNAAKQGIAMRADGYVLVSDILANQRYKSLKVTQEEIEEIVRTNDKQRFALLRETTADGREVLLVRANQGHTVSVEVELTPLETVDQFPPVAIHGTTRQAWETIRTEGLSRMKRRHIHMAPGKPKDDGVISGLRANSKVLIYIDFAKALAAGIPFFKSANGVVLSPGNDKGVIPPEFFLRIEDINGNVIQ